MTSTKILGRDDLLSGNHLKRELVPVPELEGSIYIRELTTPQVILFNRRIKELSNGEKDKEMDFEMSIEMMALAISFSACDEKGNLLFSSEDDVKQLVNNKLGVLLKLSSKAFALSGMELSAIQGLTNEVAANLPKEKITNSFSISPVNSRKRRQR